MIEVREYETASGERPFGDWLRSLRDGEARRRIVARLTRLASGNRGDWRPIGSGLFELRVDHGPGYRVYCGQDGEALVILLCAGDKRTQTEDIERAHEYWNDYQANG